jgi:simple sugar transport system permease protein
VAVTGIQPIVATLVLMVAGRGLAQLITAGRIITFNDPGFSFIGSGAVLGLPCAILIAVGLAIGTHYWLRRTAMGLFIEALGTNQSAARLSGLRIHVLLAVVYTFCGFCAAIAGLIATADIKGADANNAGLWLELDAILAVVIGGTPLFGGRFSIYMSVLGAVIIQSVNTGILVSGLPPQFNLVVKAGVIIAILVLQSDQLQAAAGFLRPRAKDMPG